MSRFVKACKVSEVSSQSARCIALEGKRIALFNLGGEFYALDDTCTHVGGPLSEGEIEGEVIQCPWHGARFNIKDGSVLGPPAPEGVTKYNVRVEGDEVEIEI